MMTIERRYSASRPTVTTHRAAAGKSAGPMLSGYAAVFNQATVIGGVFSEVIAGGAFTDALARPDDVRGVLNHDASRLLGRTASGTLRLSQDARGLRYEIDINPDDVLAMSVVAQVRRGDISGSSFAFLVDPDDERWSYPKGKALALRTVYRATLLDVSPVVFPAYEQTTVSARHRAI